MTSRNSLPGANRDETGGVNVPVSRTLPETTADEIQHVCFVFCAAASRLKNKTSLLWDPDGSLNVRLSHYGRIIPKATTRRGKH